MPETFTVHLGSVAFPTGYRDEVSSLRERTSRTGADGTTYYFIKTALPIRTAEAVTITSVDGSALVDWLDEGPTTSQRLGPCPPADMWVIYGPGGFWVPDYGCYTFRIDVGDRTATTRIPVVRTRGQDPC